MSRTLAIKREQAAKATTVAEKRTLIETGVMFARFTIRQQTAVAEKQFKLWDDAGRPDVLPEGIAYLRTAIQGTLDSVRALDDRTVANIFAYSIHDSESQLSLLVKGISCVKASFALACAGIGRRGCIDSHIVQDNFDLLQDLLSTAAKRERTSRDWTEARYKQACQRLWLDNEDTAVLQWETWLAGARSNRSGTDHECIR